MADEQDDNIDEQGNIDNSVDYSGKGVDSYMSRGDNATQGLPVGLKPQEDVNKNLAKMIKAQQLGDTGLDMPLPLADYYPSGVNGVQAIAMSGGMPVLSTGLNLFPIGLADYRESQERQKRAANMQDPMAGIDLASISDLKNSIFQQQQIQDYRDFFNSNVSTLQTKGFSKSQAGQYLMNSPEFKAKLMQWRNVASNYDATWKNAMAIQADPMSTLNYDRKTRDLATQFNDVITANKVDVSKLAEIQAGLSKMTDFNKNLDPYVKQFEQNISKSFGDPTLLKSTGDYDVLIQRTKEISKESIDNVIQSMKGRYGERWDKDKEQAIRDRFKAISNELNSKIEIAKKDNWAFAKYKKDLEKTVDISPNENVGAHSKVLGGSNAVIDRWDVSSPEYDKKATVVIGGRKYRVDQIEVLKDGRGAVTARPMVQEEGKPITVGNKVMYENKFTGATNVGLPAKKDENGNIVLDAQGNKIPDPNWTIKYSTKDVFSDNPTELNLSDVRTTLENNGFNFKGLGKIAKTTQQYRMEGKTTPTQSQNNKSQAPTGGVYH